MGGDVEEGDDFLIFIWYFFFGYQHLLHKAATTTRKHPKHVNIPPGETGPPRSTATISAAVNALVLQIPKGLIRKVSPVVSGTDCFCIRLIIDARAGVLAYCAGSIQSAAFRLTSIRTTCPQTLNPIYKKYHYNHHHKNLGFLKLHLFV